MNLLLIHAAWWPLLGLVLLPLLVHLLARARPPVLHFSSLVLLRRVNRRTQRLRRPRDWLLWLLRTLAVLALVLLVLRPVWFAGPARPQPGARRNVVVVVDASASMAYIEGSQSRFAAACAEAADVLAGLHPGDHANVIFAGARPRALYPNLGINLTFLRDQLRAARVTSELADLPAALQLAADQLRDWPGTLEIVLVSDFQQTNWDPTRNAIPLGMALFPIKVGAAAAENMALTRLYWEPAIPLPHESVAVYCEVCNYSPRPRQVSVFLRLGEQRQRQEVSLAPWSTGAAVFSVNVPEAGEFPLVAELGEDALAGDNLRQSVVKVHPHLRVGLLDQDAETAQAWQRALAALGWVQVTRLPATFWEQSSLDDDLLMLAGWDGTPPDAAQRWLALGRPIVWFPAADTPQERVQAILGLPAGPTVQAQALWQVADQPFPLVLAAPGDPLVAVFSEGQYGDPAAGVFQARLNFALPASSNLTTILEYADHVPALARARAPGDVYLWNLPVAPAASDWASRPEFLALLGEILQAARAQPRPRDRDHFFPGQEMTRTIDRDALAAEVELTDVQGQRLPVERRVVPAGTLFAAPGAREPGLFTWRIGADLLGYSVVNFPPPESDLRAVAPAATAGTAPAVRAGRDLEELQQGRELWPWCLGLLAAALLLEALLTAWSARTA